MKRTTIMADDDVMQRLKGHARERGVSLAVVIREALEEKAREVRPTPRSIGSGASSPSRTAATRGSRRTPPRSWR